MSHNERPVVYYPYATQELLPLVWEGQQPLNVTGVNTLYYINRRRMLTKQFDWLAGNPQAYLLSESYIFDPAHATLAHLPVNVRLGHAPILSRSVNAHGWACSIAIEFSNVQPAGMGDMAAAVVFTEGTAETSCLIVCFNQVVELPFTPDGRSWFFYPTSEEAGTAVGSGGWYSP